MTRLEIRALVVRLSVMTLFVGGLYLVYQAREILSALLLAGLTAVLVSPIIGVMEKRKIPSAAAISLFFIGIVLLVLFGLVVIFPLLAKQAFHFEAVIRDFVDTLSKIATTPELLKKLSVVRYLERIDITVDLTTVTNFIKDNLPGAADQIGQFVTMGSRSVFTWVFGFFGAFSNTVLYVVFLVFILAERRELFQNLVSFLPRKTASDIESKIPKIQTTLLSWWKGQAILCAFIFIMTLTVLVLLGIVFGIHIENYLSLALIAGICEFIPIIGPIIAMIPALLIGIQGGWVDAVVLVVAYVGIQQVESLFLVPRVHGTALRLSNLEVLVWMTLS